MALDSKDKRGSAIGFDKAYMRILPNPDGTISQADRQMVGYKYSGIAFTAGGGATGWGMLLSWSRNRLIIGGSHT